MLDFNENVLIDDYLGFFDILAVKKKTTKTVKKKSTGSKKKSGSRKKSKSVEAEPDFGIVIVDDDLTIDKEAELEERRAFLEEARSQEASSD